MYFEQIPAQFVLFFSLYGGTALYGLVATIYLYLRKGNAFASDVTPPIALRRWTAAFFAVVFLGHVWWLLFYIFSCEIYSVISIVIAVLDSVALLTTIPGTMFAMLQDRKRSVWPIALATIPYATLGMLNFVYPDGNFIDIAITYIVVVYVVFTLYMIFAARQYGRWLRDNYVDLEHKEVWLSHMLVIIVLLLIIIDGFGSTNIIIGIFVQAAEFVLISFLLWRVETLPQLENTSIEHACDTSEQEPTEETDSSTQEKQPMAIPSNIEDLLAKRCVKTKLFLQHDLTLLQLARIVGTNRYYLSQYFSRQGVTYNAYINDLRINHFMKLYREAIATQQPIAAQQLASKSGYRSYSTFSLAFKQRMGQSLTAWMRQTTE